MFKLLPPPKSSPRRRGHGGLLKTSSVSTSECDTSSCWSEPSGSAAPHPNAELTPEVLAAKVQALCAMLEADLIACDAKWTLFVAAALSYRYDTKLRPFPPRFISEHSGVNIDALVTVINETPKLRVVLSNLQEQNYHDIDVEVLQLLHWVLVELHEPNLRLLSDEAYDKLLNTLPAQKEIPERPTHVFEIRARTLTRPPPIVEAVPADVEGSSAVEDIDAAPEEDTTPTIEFGFYGSKLDDFFALLHRGFTATPSLLPTSAQSTGDRQQHQQQQQQQPLVLLRELSAALAESPSGAGWGASACGSMIACVALCACIDAPPQLLERKASRRGVELLAHSIELVQPRYLLLYGSRFPTESDVAAAAAKAAARRSSRPLTWLRRYKYALSLGCYLVLLASIGIANSGSGQAIRQLLSRKAEFLVEFCRRIFISD